MKNKVMLISLCALVIGLCFLFPAVKPIISASKVLYIIDPGHGLPDGGAVGIDGTTEQSLNLQIAKQLFSLCPTDSALLSRSDEHSIATVDGSIREIKVSDMKQRVLLANSHSKALWISIHMNTYSNSSVYGCQVFYRSNDQRSQQIAQKLQSLINENLQPDHPKEIKKIANDLYLFKNTQNPAILIECGFLTNADELSKLKDSSYQSKLAQLIYRSIAT